jgi:hypothetical protein
MQFVTKIRGTPATVLLLAGSGTLAKERDKSIIREPRWMLGLHGYKTTVAE